jgi:hypothetical protein
MCDYPTLLQSMWQGVGSHVPHDAVSVLQLDHVSHAQNVGSSYAS